MNEKQFYVYILTNKPYGVFYIGVTSNLIKRIYEHKNEVVDGFTKEFNLKNLVYYEIFTDAENAIKCEKRLKRWSREWKIEAINKFNPDWKDLYNEICQ
jgi:putative endonuclease